MHVQYFVAKSNNFLHEHICRFMLTECCELDFYAHFTFNDNEAFSGLNKMKMNKYEYIRGFQLVFQEKLSCKKLSGDPETTRILPKYDHKISRSNGSEKIGFILGQTPFGDSS